MKIDIGKFLAITGMLACAGAMVPGCTIESTDDDDDDYSFAGDSAVAGASGDTGQGGQANEEGGAAGKSEGEGGTAGDPSFESGEGGAAGDASFESGEGGTAGDPSFESGEGGTAGDPSFESGEGGTAGDASVEGSGGAAGDASVEGVGGAGGDASVEGGGGAAGDASVEGTGGIAGAVAAGGTSGAAGSAPIAGTAGTGATPDCISPDTVDPSAEGWCDPFLTNNCDASAEGASGPLFEACSYGYLIATPAVAYAMETCMADASVELDDVCGEAANTVANDCLAQTLDRVCPSEEAVTTCTTLITTCAELDATYCSTRVTGSFLGASFVQACMDPTFDPSFEGTCVERFDICLVPL